MSAKDMFEKLGYKQDKTNKYIVYYKPLKFFRELQIVFNLHFQSIEVRRTGQYLLSNPISLQELQAINKQIEELGWNYANTTN